MLEPLRFMRAVFAGLVFALVTTACADGGRPSEPAPLAPSPTSVSSAHVTVPTVTGPVTLVEARVPELAPLSKMAVEQAFPNLSYSGMVHLTYPDDGTNRLFLVLQPGRILAFDNHRDIGSSVTFLDIRDRVNDSSTEEGLLGLAFDPQYKTSGYFYVFYSATRPRRSVISRFSVNAEDPTRADPTSEQVILEVPQPFSNHNGGHLLFGPDGYLYVGLGDGGSGGDPRGNGQDTSTLLASILRIDVSSAAPDGRYLVPPDNPFVAQGEGVRPEIWAYGLRNPWRFTFDRETGVLWAADVGQDQFEEVDIIKPGLNYGWNLMEGIYCYVGGFSLEQLLRRGSADADRNCDQEGLEQPVIDYDHDEGCSVTGGYVYRGRRLPPLFGAYVYGDFCSGKIWALRHDGVRVTEHLEIVDSSLSISAFGEDRSGEMYILSLDGGIYRLRPR